MKAKCYHLLIASIASILLLTLATYSAAATLSPQDQVRDAWERALKMGSYRYTTEIVQTTSPLPMVVNTGHGYRQEAFHLDGEIHLHDQTMQIRLEKDGGSFLGEASGFEIKVERGIAQGRTIGGEWQELETPENLFAPNWDPLVYLAGVRHPRNLGSETRSLPGGGELTFTRFGFTLDGPALARHIRDQLEAYLRSKGELPTGVGLDVPAAYRDATGEGEIWLDERGLPLRLTLNITFPPGSREQVTATLRSEFSDFGQEITLLDALRPGGFRALLAAYGSRNALGQSMAQDILVIALAVLLSCIVVAYRRLRVTYAAVAISVILSLVVTPLLQSHQVAAFYQKMAERGLANASQTLPESQSAETDASSMSTLEPRTPAAPALASVAAETTTVEDICQDAGENSDSDADGLTCAQERALGTNPQTADSDGDLIPDRVEVEGFGYGGKTWHTDPLNADTNYDGLPDGNECSNCLYAGDWAAYHYAPVAVPYQDTDGDGTPDAFDRDNDGDGVPDDVDPAPMTKLVQTNSFSLVVDGLQPSTPAFVEIQLRPARYEQLWWALSVLDWPSGDEEGQVQRKSGNDATYLDVHPDASAPRFGYGDMRLVPMLEISIPWDSTTLGNLPKKEDAPQNITSQTDLETWLDTETLQAYGVSVKRADDHGNLVAYIPLNLVNDSTGGARVAFSARMPYRPVTSSWGAAHQARLVWLVHALTDSCTEQDDEGKCTQWSTNNEQIIQTYYEPFIVAGVSVQEEHGTSVAVVYDATSGDAYDESALWSLADDLETTFVGGRDSDGDKKRDITVAEIARRFDHATNGSVSDEERWGIPNELSVVARQYGSYDEMLTKLMTNDVAEILTNAFGTQEQESRTLLFAIERTSRRAGLDRQGTVSGTSVTLHVDRASQTVLASLQWRPYVYEGGGWSNQPLDVHLDNLSNYLRDNDPFFDPNAPGNDQETSDLKEYLLHAYYLSLVQGVSSVVQDGNTPLTYNGPVENDDCHLMHEEMAVSQQFQGYSKNVVKAAYMLRAWYQNRQVEKMMAQLGYKTVEDVGGIRRKLDKFLLQVKDKWEDLELYVLVRWDAMSTAARVATVVGAGALLAGIGVGLYYFLAADQETRAKVVQIAVAGVGVIMQTATVVQMVSKISKAAETATSLTERLQSACEEVSKAAKTAAIVGAIVSVGVTVGFFVYNMIHAGVRFGSLEFDAALANTIATSVAMVIMIAIAFIPVAGQIIAAVLGLIDAVISLVCAIIGKDASESWVCAGLTGWLAKGIAWAIYSQAVMIDLYSKHRLKTHSFDFDFASGSNGFSAGSKLQYHVGITNTIQKASLPVSGLAAVYAWQWTDHRAKSSAFAYAISADQDDLRVSRGDTHWQGHSPWYIAETVSSNPLDLPEPGLNRAVSGVYLNEGYAVPVQECWGLLVLGVCYIRDKTDTNHLDIGSKLEFDILPATLDGFHALTTKGDGYALAWGQDGDITFPILKDADGDGLMSNAYGGPDPNDSRWDSDGDGLSDPFELQNGTDPSNADTDLDGLLDNEELLRGTNPHLADSDGDGLTDGEEIEGWLFVYGYNGATPLKTRVYPSPLSANADEDEYNDVREKIFGFHPRVPSTSNILTLESDLQEPAGNGTHSRTDGYVRPGGTIHYEAQVANNLDERYAQGLLEAEFPAAIQSSLVPQPFVLHPLDKGTLSGDIQVAQDATSGLVSLTQVAKAQITDPHNLLGAPRIWLAFDEDSGATTFSDTAGVQPAYNATCAGDACPRAGVDGLTGHAVEFDGQDDYLSVADFQFNSKVAAYSVWVKPNTVSGTQAIITRGDTANTRGVSFGIKDAQVWVGGNVGSGWTSRFAGAVNAGEWTHIAAVYRQYDTPYFTRYRCEVYVNGEHVQTFTGSEDSDNSFVFQLDGSGFVTHIGKNQAGDKQFLAGALDDLRIYTHAPENWHVPVLKLGFDQAYASGKFGWGDDDSDYQNSVNCAAGKKPYCPSPADGVSGQAASFPGDRYLSPSLPDVDFSQYTLAAWVYPRDSGDSTVDAQPQGVLGVDVDATYPIASPHLVVVGRKLRVGFGTGGELVQFTTDDLITRNTWNHVVVTYGDGDGMMRVYVNGEEKASFNTGTKRPNNALYYTKMTQVGSAGEPGDFLGNANLRLFHGKIDDVLIFREPLSAAEVSNVYHSGAEAVNLRFDDPPGGRQSSDTPGKAYLENAADASGLHNGTCEGAECPVLGVAGREWRAALFDGVDDVVVLDNSQGDAFAFGGTVPFSLAAWVYPQRADGVIIGKYNHGVEGAYYLGISNDGRIQFHREVRPYDIASPNALPFARWSHVAATYDGATMRIYVNGALVGSMSSSGGMDSAPNTSITIGAYYEQGSFTRFFSGMLDDVRIYRRALGSDEVLALYRSAPALQMAFDEAHGATSFADAANNLNGTCSGSACPLAGVKGQIGLALTLDGVDDHVQVPHNADLNFGADEDFAVMFWVKAEAQQPDSSGYSDNDIVGKWAGTSGTPYAYHIQYLNQQNSDSGKIAAGRDDGSHHPQIVSAQAVNDGQFHHVAFVKSGSTLYLYIDGLLSNSTEDTTTGDTTNDAPVYIGQRGTNQHHFAGTVDELQIYRRAMSATEIQDLFRAQVALVEDRQHAHITVDAEPPTSSLTSDYPYRPNQPVQLHIAASDGHSGIAKAEWMLVGRGGWQEAPACQDAKDNVAFCPTFAPSGEGSYAIQTRATDKAGNVENPTPTVAFLVDSTPPQVTINATDGELVILEPAPDSPTGWRLTLTGTVSDPTLASGDPGSGVAHVYVTLEDPSGNPVMAGTQEAEVQGNSWTLVYLIYEAAPNGTFTAQVQAVDSVGNKSVWQTVSLQIDASPPEATVVFPQVTDTETTKATRAITETGTMLQGVVSDTVGSILAGVNGLDVALRSSSTHSPLHNELPPEGQVLHFAFEDMPDQSDILHFLDLSGNSTGTCSGDSCPQYGVQGHDGYAMQFDGTDDYVEADGTSGSLANAQALSFGAWVYPLATNGADGAILAFSTGAGADLNTIFYSTDSQQFGYQDPQVGRVPSADTFAPEKWYHVLVTVDGANQGVLYVDGHPQATFQTNVRPASDGKFSVGQKWNSSSPGSFFEGIVDEVRAFDSALTEDQVYRLFQGNTVVLLLTFDEERLYADGDPVVDQSGWGQIVTAHTGGSALRAEPGQVGAFALSLDGMDDYLAVSAKGIPVGDMAYSLAAWIKSSAMKGQGILGWGPDGDNQSTGLRLTPNGLRHYWGGDNLDAPTADLSGAWHHVAATYDGSVRVLYLDGVEIGRDSRTGHAVPDASQFLIGATSQGDYFGGQLDDVRVYPRALSATEISVLAAGGWRPATLSGTGQPTADWTYATPEGLEGNYQLDLRGWDAAGNFGLRDGNKWNGLVDTLAPRVTLWRETLQDGYRYVTTAQDFNLSTKQFQSPCGSVITDRQYYVSPWYLARVGLDQNTSTRLYQITASCDVSDGDVSETATACDAFGHCTTVSATPAPAALENMSSLLTVSEARPAVEAASPVITITDVLTRSHYTPSGYLLLQGSVSDVQNVASVLVTAIGEPLDAPIEAAVSSDAGTDGTWRAAWRPGFDWNLDGVIYDVTVQVIDLQSNTTETTSAVTIDITPPSAVTVTLRNAETGAVLTPGEVITTSSGRLRLEWTAPSDGSGLSRSTVVWSLQAGDTLSRTIAVHPPTDTGSEIVITEPQRASAQLSLYDVHGNVRWQSAGPIVVDGLLTPDYVAMEGRDIYHAWMDSGCTLLGVDSRVKRQSMANTSLDHDQHFYGTWDEGGLRLAWTGANWEGDGDLFIYFDVRDGGSTSAYNPYPATITNTVILMPFDANTQTHMDADYVLWVQDSTRADLLYWDELAGAWQASAGRVDYVFEARRDGGITDLYVPFAALGIDDPESSSVSIVAVASEEQALRLWATMPPRSPVNSDSMLEHDVQDETHLFALQQKYAWPRLGKGICPNGIYDSGPVQLYRADVTFEMSAEPSGLSYRLIHHNLFHMMHRLDQFSTYEWETALEEICWANPDALPCRRPVSGSQGTEAEQRATRNLGQAAPPPPGYGLSQQATGPAGGYGDARHTLHTLCDMDHPALGDGQVVTYTVQYGNIGEEAVSGLSLEVTTRGPIRLPGGHTFTMAEGEYDWLELDLGDLLPGEHKTVTFIGQVDLGFDMQRNDGWGAIQSVAYDQHGTTYGNQHEFLFVEHEVDQAGPQASIRALETLIGAGTNTIQGYSFDQSPVPTIGVQIRMPDGSQLDHVCTDDSPADGRWACPWDAPDASDGAIFQARVRGTDIHGQTGDWSPWVSFTQDTLAPGITLDPATRRALSDGVINATETAFRGGIADNYLIDDVEVCRAIDGDEICQRVGTNMNWQGASQATLSWNTPFVYEDAPADAVPLGSGQQCEPGNLVIRTFQVDDSFTVADVKLGLNVSHPFRADLEAWLVAPSGKWVNLLYVGTHAQNYDVLLSDDATLPASHDRGSHSTSWPLFDAVRRPYQPLGSLYGEQSPGYWHLILCDAYPEADDGFYNRSRLILTADALPQETQGSWQYDLQDLGASDNVTHSISFYGLDSVENRTAQEQALSLEFRVDTVAPRITVTQAMTTTWLGIPVAVLEGEATDGDQVTQILAWVQTPSGGWYSEYVSMLENGRWVYEFTPQLSGTYALRVEAVDRAVNRNTVGPFRVTVVPRAPEYRIYLPILSRSNFALAGRKSSGENADYRPLGASILDLLILGKH